MAVNRLERERWNNALYAELWPKRERLTSSVTATLVAAVAARPGERILDIGCGLGPTTLALAPLVGATGRGRVVGADISAPLVALARERAAAAGVDNVDFVLTDMQTDQVAGGPFAAAVSQFGVMFFDDPVAAFANVRSQLAPSGRLAFACWRGEEENSWFPGLALADVAPPRPEPPPGAGPTGPFTLADPQRVHEILEHAGFTAVTVTPHDITTEVPDDAVLDDAQMVLSRVPPERMAEAQAARTRHLDRLRARPGVVRVPLAFQIVTAVAG
jgi:SAM-dependent methyltransferase